MAVREYIGARYVPVFADPLEWDNTKSYEPLTIVSYMGDSYTSRQSVPAGIDITNTNYWAVTGNYSAQVEAYRQEVEDLKDIIPSEDFDDQNTVKEAIDYNAPDRTPFDDATWSEINEGFEDRSAFDDCLTLTDIAHKTESSKYITVKEDLTLKSAFAANMFNPLNTNIMNDPLPAMYIANTYLIHQKDLMYGNQYVATGHTGTFYNYENIDPKEHKVDDRMEIDCAVFTSLVANGVAWLDSLYSTTENKAANNVYKYDIPATRNYTRFSVASSADLGAGRLLTHQFAKMLFDAGMLEIFDGTIDPVRLVRPGDILFYGNSADKFLGIGHCALVHGQTHRGWSKGIILTESIGDYPNLGLVSRPYPSQTLPLKARFTPNYNFGDYIHYKVQTDTYHTLFNNVDLSTPQTFSAGSRIPLALAITNKNNATVTLSITQRTTNQGEATFEDTISMDISKHASHIMYIPYGWEVTLSTASASNFAIVENKVADSRYVDVPPYYLS